MARCGCAGACSCVLSVGAGLTLAGSGSVASPWAINLTVGAWTTISGTYSGTYSAYAGATYHTPMYRILMVNVVQLRGRILKTTTPVVGETIISGIPAAIRPLRNKILIVGSGDAAGDNGLIEILPAGTITQQSTLPDNYIQLDGVWYEVN